MSGIFGFWNLNGMPADPSILAEMSACLAHRGPDGSSGWCEGAVAIGHRMFRVTPESVYEAQPVVGGANGCVLTADLRLDNRRELLNRWSFTDNTSQLSDADLLSAVYAERGSAAPADLLGAFAFAAWEARQQRLTCVRDHFGEKPLYYVWLPNRVFAFASEIKALWCLGDVPDEVNEQEIARHLLIPVSDDPGATYYRAIRRVRPGHILEVTVGGIRETPYWELGCTRSHSFSSDDDCIEAVRDAFTEAVRCRLRTRGPVASMLSGGVDSSSITCVAAGLLDTTGEANPLRTFSAVFPDIPASDERPYIGAVTAQVRTAPSFFRADNSDPLADMTSMNWHGDGANRAGNLYVNWNLYNQAAASGARVILDGFDGDSTISHGDGWLVELAQTGRWWRLAREVRAKAKVHGQAWPPALYAWVRRYGIDPAIRRLDFHRPRRHTVTAPSATPYWARGLSSDFTRLISRCVTEPPPTRRTEREYHHRLMTRPLLLQTLGWLEAIGAGAGVEARFPFFDVRLAELCLSVPPQLKLRRGWSRYVIRAAMSGIVPASVQWRRKKSDLSPAFDHLLRSRVMQSAGTALIRANRSVGEFLDEDYCARMQHRLAAGAASSEETFLFWRLLSLALWLTGSRGVSTAHAKRHHALPPVIATREPKSRRVLDAGEAKAVHHADVSAPGNYPGVDAERRSAEPGFADGSYQRRISQ